LGLENVGQVAVSLREVGLEPDRRSIFGNSLVNSAVDPVYVGKVVMSLRGTGIEADRLAVFSERVVEAVAAK
jgi:hypothetical protein